MTGLRRDIAAPKHSLVWKREQFQSLLTNTSYEPHISKCLRVIEANTFGYESVDPGSNSVQSAHRNVEDRGHLYTLLTKYIL